MKKGRQSTNVEDMRGGQSTWSSAKAILTMQKNGFLRDVSRVAQATGLKRDQSIQEISSSFTNARPPAGQELPQSPDYHEQLRKGF